MSFVFFSIHGRTLPFLFLLIATQLDFWSFFVNFFIERFILVDFHFILFFPCIFFGNFLLLVPLLIRIIYRIIPHTIPLRGPTLDDRVVVQLVYPILM